MQVSDSEKSTIIYRLLKFIELKSISKREFYKTTGLSNGYLDKNSNIGSDKIEKISSAFPEINIDWLISGYGEMLRPDNQVNDSSEPYIKSNAIKIELSSGIMRVPLVSQYAYAGYLGGYSDVEFMEGLPTIPFIIDREYKGIYMAFEVRGDSMDDGSRDSYISGDILLSRQVSQTHWQNKLHINRWDFVIVHKTDGILLKKITSHTPETGDITAHSLNPDYDDIRLNLKDVVQLFNVVKVERKK
jgi:phage repressor protein C with HTH and peptisase S24 domain